MSEVKFCENCVFYRGPKDEKKYDEEYFPHRCSRKDVMKKSLVTGRQHLVKQDVDCFKEREYPALEGHCGVNGYFFKAKP